MLMMGSDLFGTHNLQFLNKAVNYYNKIKIMKQQQIKSYRTHILRFMKKDFKQESYSYSLSSRLQRNKYESILQTEKINKRQSRNTSNTFLIRLSGTKYRTISFIDPFQERVQEKQPLFKSIQPSSRQKIEKKHLFRTNAGSRCENQRKQIQKKQINKLANEFTTQRKQIFTRQEQISSFLSNQANVSSKFIPLVSKFPKLKDIRQGNRQNAMKEQLQIVDLDTQISPW